LDVVILHGDFFSYGIGYNPETEDDRLREIVEALSDYPCVDDEMVERVEQRWIEDAMHSWALNDFRRAVERQHGEDLLDEVSDETVARVFEICRQESQEEWTPENCGMHIDVEKIVPHFQSAVSSMMVTSS
jgi:hypothetical protein